mgnify:CR=1 FL=1
MNFFFNLQSLNPKTQNKQEENNDEEWKDNREMLTESIHEFIDSDYFIEAGSQFVVRYFSEEEVRYLIRRAETGDIYTSDEELRKHIDKYNEFREFIESALERFIRMNR